ncbi:hypothetical protein DFP93_12262 [Aneurinibacillus soli]|uniref:Uncharacterized protein n=1 Tax=Aneurinibacillus soli TaxID=1500254 RepID=A0A0U5B885_9BACL|nr:hypothetical protein DFP93_12262 [Aneurinibacillus soli]BAU29583.1 hypothetical protein CB4_03794 [Aneurinibacillus soli]
MNAGLADNRSAFWGKLTVRGRIAKHVDHDSVFLKNKACSDRIARIVHHQFVIVGLDVGDVKQIVEHPVDEEIRYPLLDWEQRSGISGLLPGLELVLMDFQLVAGYFLQSVADGVVEQLNRRASIAHVHIL